MNLELVHIYHRSEVSLSDINACFSEGISCIQYSDPHEKKLLFQFLTAKTSPENGQVRFLGYDIMLLGDAYKNHLSYMSRYPLYPDTFSLYHYLIHTSLLQRLSPAEARDKAQQLLREMGLEDKRHTPLSDLISKDAKYIRIIQTLRSEAPILILEKPFLDTSTDKQSQITRILSQVMDNKIIIILTEKEDPLPDLPHNSYTLKNGCLSKHDTAY